MKKRILSFVIMVCVAFTSVTAGYSFPLENVVEAATAPVNYNVFEQNDTVWKDFDPSGGADPCPIGPQGCGLFSIANAVYHLTGNTVDMRELSVWAWTNGYYKAAGATYRWQLYPNLAAKFGSKYGFTTPVKWTNGKASDTQLLNHLANGGTAVAHVYGHFICLAGYDAASGRVLVLDSAPDYERRFTQSGGSWLTVSELSGESSYMIVTGYCLLSKASASVTNYTASTSVASGSGSVFFANDHTSWKFGAGSTVFFKTIPASGYKVSSITVNGTAIAVSNNGDTASYAFTMPSANATVSVKFTTGGKTYNTALLTSAASYDVNAGLIARADCAVPNTYIGLFPASATTYTKNTAVFYYSAPQYWYFGVDSANGPYSSTRHLQCGLRGGNYLSYGAGSFKVLLFNSSGSVVSNILNVTLSGTANHYGALTFIPGNSTGGNTGGGTSGGTTGGTDTTLYTVSISSTSGGTAHFGNGVLSGQVTAGTVVNYQVDPSAGYVVSKILVNGVSQTIQNNGGSYVYNFIMTAQTTTVSVTFSKASSSAFPSNDIIFDNDASVSWIKNSGLSAASVELTTDANSDTYMKITAAASNDPQVNMNFKQLDTLSASSYKYMVITARTTSSNTFGKMYLCPGSITGATEDCTATWNWNNDGLWHDYLIDLSGKTNWTGNLNLIRFDFFDGTTTNGMALDLRSIKFYTSSPSTPTIKTNKTSYTVGESITLNYSGLDSYLSTQQNQIPFIAIYAKGTEPGSAPAGLYTMVTAASGKAVYPTDAVGGLYFGKTLAAGTYKAWIAYDAQGTSDAYNLGNVHYAAASSSYEFTIVENTPTLHKVSTKVVSGQGVAHFGGNITSADVYSGSTFNYQVTPSAGYKVTKISINGVDQTILNSGGDAIYSYTMGAEDTVISVTFSAITYKITVTTPTNGTVTLTNNSTGATITSGSSVAHGTVIKVTATANTGYQLSTLKAGSTSLSSGGTFTVSAATTVTATFAKKTYAITITNPTGATITLKDASGNAVASGANVAHGTVLTVTLTPSSGYRVKTVTIGGTAKKTYTTMSTTAVTYSHTVSAATTISGTAGKIYKVSFSQPTGGTIAVTNNSSGAAISSGSYVDTGTVIKVTATASTGYNLSTLKAGSTTLSSGGTYTVSAATTVSATFAKKTYKVTVSASNGTVTLKDASGNAIASGATVEHGTVITVTATPATGYKLSTLKAGSTSLSSGGTFTLTADTTVTGTFTKQSYTMTITNPTGGTITVTDASGNAVTTGTAVAYKSVLTVTLTPSSGYRVKTITVNGTSKKTNSTISSAAVTYSYTVGAAAFTLSGTCGKIYKVSFSQPTGGTIAVTNNSTGATISSGSYVDTGTVIKVTATPSTGYNLSTLKAGSTTLSSGGTYTVSAATTVSATFAKKTYKITITAPTNGTITITNNATGDAIANGATVEHGTVIKVTATPSTGYSLSSLKAGSTSLSSGDTYTVNAATTVAATFTAIEYNVTIAVAGGSGTAAFADGTTSTKGTIGQSISYTLTPATGYKVSKITVNGTSVSVTNSGATATYTLTMTAAETAISVTFAKKTYAVSVGEVTNGTVTLSSTGNISYNTTITVTATPNEGYELDQIFVNGTAISGNTFKVTKASTVTATFKKIQCAVSVGTVSNGKVTISPTGTVDYGTTITV
ncbi:MAG: hypothetical protein E7384_07765, partial [Ruminococcaceae bacterium]|nr:hypothetical protein [Oscillospiraceae bacterium]